MYRRLLRLLPCAFGLSACVAMSAGCYSRSRVVSAFYAGDYAFVMEEEQGQAAKGGKSTALHLLRYATAAQHTGHWRDAHGAFERACRLMDNFSGGGEFRAVVVKEAEKEYRGEPYEQMLAFLYLGLVDLGLGDVENALAAFKTAARADSGSAEERYRSDSILLPWLQGICYKALNEHAESDEAFRMARRIVVAKNVYRAVTVAVSSALSKGTAGKLSRTDRRSWLAAEDLLRSHLAEVILHAEHPDEALDMVVEAATATVKEKRYDGVGKETARVLKKHGDTVLAKMDSLSALARANISSRGSGSLGFWERSALEFIDAAAGLPSINLMVVIQVGKGPYKYAAGRYGSELRFGPPLSESPTQHFVVKVGNSELLGGFMLEDVCFQAATRGGRAIDDILKTKADLKLLLKLISYAPYAGVAGTIASFIQPKADTRHWEFLPGQIYVAVGQVPDGLQRVDVGLVRDETAMLKPFATTSVEVPTYGLKVLIIRDEPPLRKPVIGDESGNGTGAAENLS